MPAIALASVGIWFYFLVSRRRLSVAEAAATDLESRLVAPRATLSGAEVATVSAQLEESAAARLGRDLVVLGALTAVAPLLGLLGTVVGMIDTFEAVARVSGDPGLDMSGGISQALITTQFGLVVAIPGVFGVARLQRVMRALRVRFQCCQSRLLLAAEGASRRPEVCHA